MESADLVERHRGRERYDASTVEKPVEWPGFVVDWVAVHLTAPASSEDVGRTAWPSLSFIGAGTSGLRSTPRFHATGSVFRMMEL